MPRWWNAMGTRFRQHPGNQATVWSVFTIVWSLTKNYVFTIVFILRVFLIRNCLKNILKAAKFDLIGCEFNRCIYQNKQILCTIGQVQKFRKKWNCFTVFWIFLQMPLVQYFGFLKVINYKLISSNFKSNWLHYITFTSCNNDDWWLF